MTEISQIIVDLFQKFYPNHKNSLLGLTTARYASSGADLPSHELVKLPALSPTMEQGTIVTWEKKVGGKYLSILQFASQVMRHN